MKTILKEMLLYVWDVLWLMILLTLIFSALASFIVGALVPGDTSAQFASTFFIGAFVGGIATEILISFLFYFIHNTRMVIKLVEKTNIEFGQAAILICKYRMYSSGSEIDTMNMNRFWETFKEDQRRGLI